MNWRHSLLQRQVRQHLGPDAPVPAECEPLLRAVEEAYEHFEAERRRAEESLARMAAILDATTDFVGIADAGGRALYVNAAGRRMIGMKQEDVSQTTIRDYFTVPVGETLAKD